MTKEYRSFEEIDKRLKILKLRREIDRESLKLHYHRAKVDLIPRRLPRGIGTTFVQNGTWKNMLLALAAKKVLGILRKKRFKEIHE